MAEVVAAAFAAATAFAKLGRFVHEQAGFLDVKDDVKRLDKELEWMQSFLKDAENKLDGSELSQQWMSDVRDLAFKCEDVIETFLGELGKPKTFSRCLTVMPGCCISYTSNPRITHKLKSEIEILNRELNDIRSRRERYELKNNDVGTSGSKNGLEHLMELRRTTPCVNNECMVGQEDTVSLLMTKLRDGRTCLFVLSIIGMGGLGKTTIARKLYNNLQKRDDFTCYAWVCVSQLFDPQTVLLHLINSMTKASQSDLDGLKTTPSMESYLYNFLRTHKFLIVLDDLWESAAWVMLQRALPDNNNGSRIIITSRNVKVATRSKAYVHELRCLQEDESWELFRKNTFPDDIIISPTIENLGKEMVPKCLGLPLAIVTLGGLLSTKSNSVSEWKLIRDYLWKELEKDSLDIKAVLSLSYSDLPPYLKQCFLYVGMFPEDFEIPISKLILLWVAEGFIVSERRSPESVAKFYFNELVGRSLFQKKGEDWIDSTFKVHDLLRDLAIEKAKEEGFSVYYDGKRLNKLTDCTIHRRLVACQSEELLNRYKNPSLRTLFMSSTESPSNELLRSVDLHYGLLRVLDIHVDGYLLCIPKNIGRLIHLRYIGLDIRTDLIMKRQWEMPDTIGDLKALQTLSIRTWNEMTLPSTMEKLQALRHLILFGKFVLGDWIGKMIGLETLQEITFELWSHIDTTNLVNLRHLSLFSGYKYYPRFDLTRCYDNFQTTTKLQTLSLESWMIFPLDLSTYASRIFQCCPDITHFKLVYDNFSSANLHEFATNLEVLDLSVTNFSSYKDDPMPVLERLPALRALRLKINTRFTRDSDLKPKIVCSEKGFPQLRTLHIQLYDRVTLVVEEGGMPLLTCLKTNEPRNAQIVIVEAPKRLMDLIELMDVDELVD